MGAEGSVGVGAWGCTKIETGTEIRISNGVEDFAIRTVFPSFRVWADPVTKSDRI